MMRHFFIRLWCAQSTHLQYTQSDSDTQAVYLHTPPRNLFSLMGKNMQTDGYHQSRYKWCPLLYRLGSKADVSLEKLPTRISIGRKGHPAPLPPSSFTRGGCKKSTRGSLTDPAVLPNLSKNFRPIKIKKSTLS
jgi:hypothetical protein